MIKTSLIISTYNWPDALELCLKSVLKQRKLPDEIIIADDGSGKDTKTIVQKYSKSFIIPVKHVWQDDKGFRLARIRNLAIENSESDYLIFIDGDIVLHPKFVSDHIKNRKIDRFITGSRVLLSKNETFQRLDSTNVRFKHPFFSAKNKLNGIQNHLLSILFSKKNSGIYNVRGCNMSFWKKDLYEVNGFDERFAGWGREDSDIVFRLMQTGKTKFKLKFSAVQYHLFHHEEDRSSFIRNDKLLNKTISDNRIKAKIGLTEL